MKRHYCILILNLIFISSYAQPTTSQGGHYLFAEFTKGVILFKEGYRDVKMLNYHVLAEALVFDNQGRILAVPKAQMKRIDTLFINGRRFVILGDKFVELLHRSALDLFVEYKGNLVEKGKNAGFGGASETSAINTPAGVRLGGSIYDLQLPEGYETKRNSFYWLKKDGALKQVVNMKQLKKLYKSKNDLFNEYVKKRAVQFEDQELMVQLIVYLESN